MDSLNVPSYNRPRNNSRDSYASSQFSAFSEVSSLPSSEVPWTSEQVSEPTETSADDVSRSHKLRDLLSSGKGLKGSVFTNEHEEQHRVKIDKYLTDKYYSYAKAEKLVLPWNELFEIYVFGDVLQSYSDDQLWSLLLNHVHEGGEYLYRSSMVQQPLPLNKCLPFLEQLAVDLGKFEEILDLYSKQENWNSDILFEAFHNFISCLAVPIPMSLTLFADYMLSIKHASTEFYMCHIFKLIRLLWYIYLLNQRNVFDSYLEQMEKGKQILVRKFLNKDNRTSLGLSLFHLGEFFQIRGDINTATNLWEVSGHITKDPECCQMAIWGITDGYGSGNKYKLLNKLGKKTKTNKYNTKRRIAQLYRVLNEKEKQDIGVSWVWKEKYD